MRKNKIKILLVLTLAIVVTSACGYEKIKKTKVKDMDYTVVAENEMPKEVKEIIEKRKDKEFQVTYSNNEDLLLPHCHRTVPAHLRTE